MNDSELIMELREQRRNVSMTTPVEQIIRRGRVVRAWRRIPVVAAAVTASAAVAVPVSGALASHSGSGDALASNPGARHALASHPAAGRPASGHEVRLAAWTVTRQPSGSIRITFREAADAAGLQRTLRADGIPASVTFTGRQNPACKPFSQSGGSPSLSWGKPPGGPPTRVLLGPPGSPHNIRAMYSTPYALVIHPSALPSGAGLQIWTSGIPGGADNFQVQVSLVRASPQCTGS
jgi:hypothetical protein